MTRDPVPSESNKMTRESIRTCLKNKGILKVEVNYEGSGDEGGISSINKGTIIKYLEGKQKSLTGMNKPSEKYVEMTESELSDMFTNVDVLYNFFYGLLEDNVAGYEINEGSYGTIYWNVDIDKIVLSHTEITHLEQTREKQL